MTFGSVYGLVRFFTKNLTMLFFSLFLHFLLQKETDETKSTQDDVSSSARHQPVLSLLQDLLNDASISMALVPYLVFLVVPILGMMTDPVLRIRQVSGDRVISDMLYFGCTLSRVHAGVLHFQLPIPCIFDTYSCI